MQETSTEKKYKNLIRNVDNVSGGLQSSGKTNVLRSYCWHNEIPFNSQALPSSRAWICWLSCFFPVSLINQKERKQKITKSLEVSLPRIEYKRFLPLSGCVGVKPKDIENIIIFMVILIFVLHRSLAGITCVYFYHHTTAGPQSDNDNDSESKKKPIRFNILRQIAVDC